MSLCFMPFLPSSQSNHLRRNRWEGTAERDHSTPKAASVKANYCGKRVNAASDGAFAKINKCDQDTCQQKDNRGGFNEGH
jgi:hypothetical protein